MTSDTTRAAAPPGLRLRSTLAIGAAVVAAHAWLAVALTWGGAGAAERSPPRTFALRLISPPPADPAAAAPAIAPAPLGRLPPPVAAATAAERPAVAAETAPAPRMAAAVAALPAVFSPAAAAAAPAAAPDDAQTALPAAVADEPGSAPAAQPLPALAAADESVAESTVEVAAELAHAAASRGRSASAADPRAAEVPIYRTRMPPPAQLRYDLRRGLLSGRGTLVWQPSPDGYALAIEGVAFGVPVLGWASHGGYDRAGLAPQRFVDRRRGRSALAANFQRDRGLVTYSSSPAEHALLPGAQDRLSFLIQLAAIVEADPGRYVAGEQVSMQVSGARGDADVWTFVVGGRETVEIVGAPAVEALVLRRMPRREFDTRAEVWLDPARHHLPVRLKLTHARESEALEFLLRAGEGERP